MTQTTQQCSPRQKPALSLERKLAAYALAGGAVLASADKADAGIIYSGIQDIPINSSHTSAVINLDNNGDNDFTINFSTVGSTGFKLYITSAENGVVGKSGFASALNFGTKIGSSKNFSFSPTTMASKASSKATGVGPWLNAGTKFLGLASDGGYGWARVTVNSNGTATLVDWGFNPNGPIDAGQGIPAPVPEPNSLLLFALGAVGVAVWLRLRKNALEETTETANA